MSDIVSINKKVIAEQRFALFDLGFRPFFLAAAVFSVISMVMWMLNYVFAFRVEAKEIAVTQLHAHEMIYGYGMAVIAGFLLTAVMNWTGVQTIRHSLLGVLCVFWAVPRLLFLHGTSSILAAAILDLTFNLALLVALTYPIAKVRQWNQMAILSKIYLLAGGNICFYLGALGVMNRGIFIGVYAGLFATIGLILAIGGRIVPMFIRNAAEEEVSIWNSKSVAIGSMALFLPFLINELFVQNYQCRGILSAGLFFINSIRVYGWYSPLIWKQPLLWSLYFSYVSINIGFLLFALSVYLNISHFLSIHAFAYGGIGISTISMMSRVTLGHTGRKVNIGSKSMSCAFTLITIGGVVRVLLPIVMPSYYILLVFISQICWILAFLLFLNSHSEALLRPNVVGSSR